MTTIPNKTENPDEAERPEDKAKAPSILKRIGLLISLRWPEYFLEIIVVIIGITNSFAISSYQQNTANNKLEEIYLKGPTRGHQI